MADCKALSIQSISFKFEKRSFDFFKNLTIDFDGGKIHFIRGQNGVGKSTLFRLLQGNVDRNEIIHGRICVDDTCYNFDKKGQEISKSLARIKMVQQKFDLMLADQFSFEQNLQLANMNYYPSLDLLPKYQELPDLIKRFDINIKVPVYLLSGGQRQILAILMALQKPTRILLLDEPTAALDDKNSRIVMAFIDDLVKATKLTVFVICHDISIVDIYAQEGYYEMLLDEQTKLRTIEFKSIKALK